MSEKDSKNAGGQGIGAGASNVTPIRPNVRYRHGGGGERPTVDTETRNYVDARTEATRSQNEAQFARIMARLEQTPTTRELVKWIVGSAIALFTAFVAVLAFGGDRFDSGVAAATLAFENSEEARENSEEAREIAEDNRKDIREIKSVLEAMTENLQAVVAIVNRKDE